MPDDDDLFGKAMHGVRKLETESRRHANKPRIPMRKAGEENYHAFPVVEGNGPALSTEPWTLIADGVSQERLRQLANGRPPVDVEVDLHGMTREEAFGTLDHSMQQALTEQYRVLCLVHGRGLHSQDGRPVLKEAVYRWLAEGPFASHVLGVISKPGTRGGSCLVLLRRKR